MENSRYLDLIRADGDRLLEAALRAPDAVVPSCPGWTGLDVVRHVGEVYEHKILCMRLARAPEDAERDQPPDDVAGLGRWFLAQRDALLGQLAARGPEEPSFTWFPPDQTVGFWFRRMAQETAVHRVDAELACGRETPVAADLAADGVDELIGFLTYDFGSWAKQPSGAGRSVELRCDGLRWVLALREDRVDRAGADVVPDAVVEGEPGDLLLHLWGRLPADARSLRSTGDAGALDALRSRLREASQ